MNRAPHRRFIRTNGNVSFYFYGHCTGRFESSGLHARARSTLLATAAPSFAKPPGTQSTLKLALRPSSAQHLSLPLICSVLRWEIRFDEIEPPVQTLLFHLLPRGRIPLNCRRRERHTKDIA